MQPSPFFRPGSNNNYHHHVTLSSTSSSTTDSQQQQRNQDGVMTRMVIVQERTPKGKHVIRTIQKQTAIQQESKSTLVGTTSNLINAIVGAGIVGIPYAVNQCGFMSGILLIIICAYITDKSLYLLITTAKHIHVPTYETLAEGCFGSTGYYFICMNMFICAYGAMVSYLLIMKQTFGALLLSTNMDDITNYHAIAYDTIYMRRILLFIISFCVVLPIACKRDMADLAITSRFNVLIDTLLVLLITITSIPIILKTFFHTNDTTMDSNSISSDNTSMFQNISNAVIASITNNNDDTTTKTIHWFFRGPTIFIGLGVLSFAYVCQHSAFIIAGSLIRPTSKRWSIVTTTALSISCILNLLCGTMGYLAYQGNTQGNILENLGRNNVPANIARAMLGTTLLFVYPLESFVARHVCIVLLFTGRMAHEGNDTYILSRRDRRIIITTVLYIIAIIPALLTNDLGPVLAITGTIGGSCLSYLGPGVIYLGVHGERFNQLARQSFGGRKNITNINNIDGHDEETNNSSNMLRAVETTPLVVSSGNSNAHNSVNDDNTNSDTIQVVGIWNHIVWYLMGMPIWCYIAKLGHVQVEHHIHEMAMKSPHPIRIGDVVYQRMMVPMNRNNTNDNNNDEEISTSKKIGRDRSMPQLSNLVTASNTGSTDSLSQLKPNIGSGVSGGVSTNIANINRQIGQGILEQHLQQQKQKTVQTNEGEGDLEIDPQEEPPSWYDFFVAISLIIIGLVALVAGLYSIFI
jgi:solute carrier family 38 (sodium-coupled neutral amino acid transporter), member 11